MVAELEAIIQAENSVEDVIKQLQPNPAVPSPLNEAITTLMTEMNAKKAKTEKHTQKYEAATKLEAGLKSLIDVVRTSSPASSIQTSLSSIIVSGLTLEIPSGGIFSNNATLTITCTATGNYDLKVTADGQAIKSAEDFSSIEEALGQIANTQKGELQIPQILRKQVIQEATKLQAPIPLPRPPVVVTEPLYVNTAAGPLEDNIRRLEGVLGFSVKRQVGGDLGSVRTHDSNIMEALHERTPPGERLDVSVVTATPLAPWRDSDNADIRALVDKARDRGAAVSLDFDLTSSVVHSITGANSDIEGTIGVGLFGVYQNIARLPKASSERFTKGWEPEHIFLMKRNFGLDPNASILSPVVVELIRQLQKAEVPVIFNTLNQPGLLKSLLATEQHEGIDWDKVDINPSGSTNKRANNEALLKRFGTVLFADDSSNPADYRGDQNVKIGTRAERCFWGGGKNVVYVQPNKNPDGKTGSGLTIEDIRTLTGALDIEPPASVRSPIESKAGAAFKPMRAGWNFTTTNPGEISMEKGDQVQVLEADSGDGWTKVSNTRGETGLVPTNHLEEIKPT